MLTVTETWQDGQCRCLQEEGRPHLKNRIEYMRGQMKQESGHCYLKTRAHEEGKRKGK